MATGLPERIIDYLLEHPSTTRSDLNQIFQLRPGQLSSIIFKLKKYGVINSDLKLLREKYTGDLKTGIMALIKPHHNKENCLGRTEIARYLLVHESDVRAALRELHAENKVQAVKNNNGYILPKKSESEYLALYNIVITKSYPINPESFLTS